LVFEEGNSEEVKEIRKKGGRDSIIIKPVRGIIAGEKKKKKTKMELDGRERN